MTQTTVSTNSQTECTNGECVRVTTSCVDGTCTETRVEVDESDVISSDDTVTTSNGSSASTTVSNKKECKFDNRLFAIVFQGFDATIISIVLSTVMFFVFIMAMLKGVKGKIKK